MPGRRTDMAVTAPADRRFRRAQVKPSRRRRLWARWFQVFRMALVVVAIAYSGWWVTRLVLGSAYLRIERLTVQGNQRLSTGEVLTVVRSLRGQNIFLADLGDARRRLLRSPWVGEAALRRIIPSTVEIMVSERIPLGIARLSGHLYLIDARGTVIDEYGPPYAELDLPMIDGLVGTPGDGGPTLDERRTTFAAAVMDSLRRQKGLLERLSQIDVTDPNDAVVILTGDLALIHLGAERFAERLQQYVELAPALRERVPAIDYVDLRFDERLYVRPVVRADRSAENGVRATTAARRSPGF